MKITPASHISFTPQYLTVDGEPWFPIMGEIHYSRVTPSQWKTELLKMKAGGVDVISAYTIWIHHEEIEGEWDFTERRNLHVFLETVRQCGLYCVLRIGPWAHGEVRNGGFPDWLVEKGKAGMGLRENDPAYFAYVEKFYKKIYEQAKGLFLKDGGPIVGIQIENEYAHCGGGLHGEAGDEHMRTLQRMAQRIGFDAPLYTATGWGGAMTGGMLPVMGGYCEAPWDQRLTEIEPSVNYLFTEERNDHGIGSDYGLGEGITFDMTKFPYLTAELGGGLQVTAHRRPIATAKDIAASSMVKLGSGCNLLGYYMYHGGTNPEGKLTTLQESRATGYPNDLPVKSYDFNAPIREYGQLTDTYREIRRLSMFVKDYEDLLCRTVYIPQPGNPEDADDFESVRSAVRAIPGGNTGFLFLNNYQRRYSMAEHVNYVPRAYGSDTINADGNGIVFAVFPEMDLHDGDFSFHPFNLPVGRAARAAGLTEQADTAETALRDQNSAEGGSVLKSTNAIPLCILHGNCSGEGAGDDCARDIYVFYTRDGVEPVYDIQEMPEDAEILTLTDEEALHAVKAVIGGRERLVISSEDIIVDENGHLHMLSCVEDSCQPDIKIIPDVDHAPKGFVKIGPSLYWSEQILRNTSKAEQMQDGQILMTDLCGEETMLYIDYDGFSAEMYQDGRLIADNFYTGQTWETGFLGRENQLVQIKITPLTMDTPVYLQEWPKLQDGRAAKIHQVRTASIFCHEIVFD